MEFALTPSPWCNRILRIGLLTLSLGVAPMLFATPLDGVAVVVDDKVILNSDIEMAMADARRQINARQQPMPSDDVLKAEVTRQLIMRKVQLDLAERSSMTVDDQTLNAALSEMAQQRGAPSLVAFQQGLDSRQAGAYARLRQQVRDDLTINRLRQQRVSARVRVSERDIDNFLASPQSQVALETEYRLVHFLIKLPENPTEALLQQAMQQAASIAKDLDANVAFEGVVQKHHSDSLPVGGGDMGWRKPAEVPADFAATVEQLSAGQTAQPIRNAEGIHIIKMLDRRGADNVKVQQWQVRHILISPNDVVSLADAQARAEDLYQKLQQGGDFDTLAKTYSNDPGSARSGGSLGWVSPGEMVPEFESMMRKTSVGDFSTPFQTQFGWHILQVQGERNQDISEQYRRGIARQTLFQRKFDQELDNWLREIRANAYVDIRNPNS